MGQRVDVDTWRLTVESVLPLNPIGLIRQCVLVLGYSLMFARQILQPTPSLWT